ncbi:MAG: A/G-specific adenine glycosylase [Terriglobia bacterium]|jgi:A/G-specific adenine glycosylase|nr:A/G-specific adenine glycosylase [Terriglobia bacterium]
MSRSGGILDNQDLARVQNTLLAWYRRERRDLPWRETRDPYRIWISEIMLQQTRVTAVLKYYRRFLARFPDVHTLAVAKEADVLAVWSGLGYYRRARAMHAAARKIVAEFGGNFPGTAGELLNLPGIGRYTAAAVASIAFGEPVAVVDGNVERVLARFLGQDLRQRNEAWQHASVLLPAKYPGDWNQAMMELGATVCLPEQPRCLLCPVKNWCADPGRQTKKPRGDRHKRELIFGLAQRRGSVYLIQRNSKDRLMAGMWEIPPTEKADDSPLFLLRHSITNSDYTVLVFPLAAAEVRGGRWIALKKSHELPLTGLTRKILRAANLWKSP